MICMNFFPTPYPDELLYSVLARYCMRSGNIREIHNFEDLFGTRNCVAVMELATNLDGLIERMPVNTKYTTEYLIYNHTLFPYLAAFIPPERSAKVVNHMRNGNGSVSYISIGLVSSSMSLHQYFRFCPECLKEDIAAYGEPYWHRIHQAAGVFVCLKHKMPLYNSKELIRGGNRQRYINASIENCVASESIKYPADMLQKMLWLAEDVETLLQSNFPFREQEWFKDQFRVKLVEIEYARMNNFIHQKRLKEDFQNFYGESYLELLQSSVSKGVSWLDTILRSNNRVTSPVRYLLLTRFLHISLQDLFYTELKPPMDKDCGENNAIAYQQLWDSRLIELCNTGLSIRAIASIIGSTPKTVRRHIDRLGIEPFWKYNGGGQFVYKKYTDTEEFKQRRDMARNEWLQLHKDNPDKSSNKIRKEHDGVYTWLSRYDKDWLQNNYRSASTKPSGTVDWKKRDMEWLPKIKEVVEEMRIGKPQRITWSTVGSKLGISGWLAKRKNKLPLIKEYMESVVETLEEFQVRKIKWAVKELESEGKELTLWNIVEIAGVKPRYMKVISKNIYSIFNDRRYNDKFT